MIKTKTITLTEDFYLKQDDGEAIIFEPGDKLTIEYKDDEVDGVENGFEIEEPEDDEAEGPDEIVEPAEDEEPVEDDEEPAPEDEACKKKKCNKPFKDMVEKKCKKQEGENDNWVWVYSDEDNIGDLVDTFGPPKTDDFESDEYSAGWRFSDPEEAREMFNAIDANEYSNVELWINGEKVYDEACYKKKKCKKQEAEDDTCSEDDIDAMHAEISAEINWNAGLFLKYIEDRLTNEEKCRIYKDIMKELEIELPEIPAEEPEDDIEEPAEIDVEDDEIEVEDEACCKKKKCKKQEAEDEDEYVTKGKQFCNVCGKELPLDKFTKDYGVCDDCCDAGWIRHSTKKN